jgi:hypothetical protein
VYFGAIHLFATYRRLWIILLTSTPQDDAFLASHTKIAFHIIYDHVCDSTVGSL